MRLLSNWQFVCLQVQSLLEDFKIFCYDWNFFSSRHFISSRHSFFLMFYFPTDFSGCKFCVIP